MNANSNLHLQNKVRDKKETAKTAGLLISI